MGAGEHNGRLQWLPPLPQDERGAEGVEPLVPLEPLEHVEPPPRRGVGLQRRGVAKMPDAIFADSAMPMILMSEEQAMFLAVKERNLTMLEEILNGSEVDINATDEANWTALHLAAEADAAELVELLVKWGAGLEMRGGENGHTPLMRTAVTDAAGAARVLLTKGADVHAISQDGNAAIHLVAEHNAGAVAELLVRSGAGMKARNQAGWTPLELTAKYDADVVATVFLQHGAEVNAHDQSGWTPMHCAAKFKANATAAVLLKHGAVVNAQTQDGSTPLHFTAKSNANYVAELLLQHGANVNALDKNGWAPLHFAAKNAAAAVARVLVQHGAKVNALTKDHETALILAVAAGATDICIMLYDEGADMNVKEGGLTPFAVAASRGWTNTAWRLRTFTPVQGLCIGLRQAVLRDRADFLKHMLQWKPQLRECVFQDNERLLAVAAFAIARGSLIVLASHGASNMGQDANPAILGAARGGNYDFIRDALDHHNPCLVFDEGKRTPAHVVVKFAYPGSKNHQKTLEVVLQQERAFTANHGKHCIRPAEDGTTPIFAAVQGNNIDAMKTLLENGERLDSVDKEKRIPLFNALRSDSLDTLQYILELKQAFDINHRAQDGSTALLNATVAGVTTVVFKLLAVGAHANTVDKAGCLALHRAFAHHDAEVVEELATLLIERTDRVDSTCVQMHGKTPLHLSAKKGIVKVCEKVLLECRTWHRKCLEVEDEEGKTPLWDAAAGDNFDIVSMFVDAGARVDVTAKDKSTLLNMVLNNSTRRLSEHRVAKFLLARGARLKDSEAENPYIIESDRKMVSDRSRSRLHWSAFACDLNASRLALHRQGRSIIWAVDEEGSTALAIAQQQNCSDDVLAYMDELVDDEYRSTLITGIAINIAIAGSLVRRFGKVQESASDMKAPVRMAVYVSLFVALVGPALALIHAIHGEGLDWISKVIACCIPVLVALVFLVAKPGSTAAKTVVAARVCGKKMLKLKRIWTFVECVLWLAAVALVHWARPGKITTNAGTLLILSSVLKVASTLPWQLWCADAAVQASQGATSSGGAASAAPVEPSTEAPPAAAPAPGSSWQHGGVDAGVSEANGRPLLEEASVLGSGDMGSRPSSPSSAAARAKGCIKRCIMVGATCGVPLWAWFRFFAFVVLATYSMQAWRSSQLGYFVDDFSWCVVVAGFCLSDFIYAVWTDCACVCAVSSMRNPRSESMSSVQSWMHGIEMISIPAEEPKFAGKLELGQSKTAALGIEVALGITEEDKKDQRPPLELMEQEIMKNGKVDDRENFNYIAKGVGLRKDDLPSAVKASMKSGKYHGGNFEPGDYDTGNEGKVLADWMNDEQVKTALLTEAEVVALRLYTTSTYRSLNTPMRYGVKPHPLKFTMWHLFEGIKKMRAVRANTDGFMKKITLWRGMKDMDMDLEDFKAHGGTELAPMSTTNDRAVAMDYAKSGTPLVFKYDVDSMAVGVNIKFLSLYPKEEEFLYPPLTHLKYVSDYWDIGVHIVEIQPTMA